MELTRTDIVDRAAMALSGALVLLGTVGLGIVEILVGKPYSPAPLTNDAGEVVATPAIDPTLRTGLVLAGLLVVGLWRLYRLAAADPGGSTDRREVVAD